MLPLLRRFASRFVKELIFAFVVGLIADIGIDAVRDWAKNRPKEQIAEKPADRTEIAKNVVPPLPKITIEDEPAKIAQKPVPPTPSVEKLEEGPIMDRDGRAFAEAYKFRCTDDKGIQGEFRAAIFLHQYNWEFGADGVQLAGASQSFDSILREEGLREALGDARELIAIGTASCEGGKEGEEIRAGNRALLLSAKVRGIIKPPGSAPTINSYYINLGQFRPKEPDGSALCDGEDSASTRSQRKIILVAVDRKDDELNLRWCLGQILAKCPDLDRYSNFDNFELAW